MHARVRLCAWASRRHGSRGRVQ